MIPEELHLRNFLSHRETDLDLRGIHLASLVGENGAGKSALLDAITWAVWGRARTGYGHDDDLVYHGENNLEVEFVFRMPYQGGRENRCRILRRREKRGRRSNISILDFQIEGDAGWRVLTADSIRETQARIIAQLGLDYDTFINSAYLRQGHADEFTVQTPTERKRVLSNILGLDRWDLYQERAKKRFATTQGQIKEVERRLNETEEELARRPEYEEALAKAEIQAHNAESELHTIQTQVDELNRVREQALGLRRQIDGLNIRIGQEEARLIQLTQDAEAHQARKNYYEDMVAHAQDIESNYQAYKNSIAEERAWGEKLSQSAQLQAEKSRWEQVVAQAREELNQQLREIEGLIATQERTLAAQRAQLESQCSDWRGQIAPLKERVIDVARQEELTAAQAQLNEMETLSVARDAARESLQDSEVERTRRIERNRQLREQMNETKLHLESLSKAETQSCPLCRQPLQASEQARLLEEITVEGKAMGDEFRANNAHIQALQESKGALERQLRQHEQQLRTRPYQEQKVARLQQQAEQSQEAQARIATLETQIAAHEQQLNDEAYGTTERESLHQLSGQRAGYQAQLDADDYAAEARNALQNTLEKLAALGYDAGTHQNLKARLQDLSEAEAEYRELEKARISVEKESETLKRLDVEIENQNARQQQLQSEVSALQNEIATLKPKLDQGPSLSQQLNTARQAESLARQRVGATRQNLAALDTLERRSRNLRSEHSTLATRSAVLGELRDAFGVNGIPAMIIEHTLPELEREANRLLQRLSGGRMHVRFDTQRETKSGNVRETLDIVISDEKGTRPYENFSGGEQFRVNFAIRVALSRLLSQRAGVRLRSLFVDEGFGALDSDGRQRLVEAVKAVQSEFDLILVITHIDELREAFPTQIQVAKNDGGSLVEIV